MFMLVMCLERAGGWRWGASPYLNVFYNVYLTSLTLHTSIILPWSRIIWRFRRRSENSGNSVHKWSILCFRVLIQRRDSSPPHLWFRWNPASVPSPLFCKQLCTACRRDFIRIVKFYSSIYPRQVPIRVSVQTLSAWVSNGAICCTFQWIKPPGLLLPLPCCKIDIQKVESHQAVATVWPNRRPRRRHFGQHDDQSSMKARFMILPRNPRINDANNMNRLPIMGTTKLCVRDIVLALVVSVTRLMNRIDPPSAQNRKILPFINYSVHKFQKSPNDPG